MAVLAEHSVVDQHPLGVEHHQGLTGQGPGLGEPQRLDPMLGPRQVAAVEDLDAIAPQQGSWRLPSSSMTRARAALMPVSTRSILS